MVDEGVGNVSSHLDLLPFSSRFLLVLCFVAFEVLPIIFQIFAKPKSLLEFLLTNL